MQEYISTLFAYRLHLYLHIVKGDYINSVTIINYQLVVKIIHKVPITKKQRIVRVTV